MSAWDVAGAVVWTPLAAFQIWATWRKCMLHDELAIPTSVIAACAAAGAVFSIARLCGAHA